MSDITHLISLASSHLHGVDLSPLRRAYDFIIERHAGKEDLSGRPYTEHLVEVASILAGMRMDLSTIVAGLLHGTLKEGVASKADLAKDFGEDVARIVDGATRVTNVPYNYNSHLSHDAENLRKLMLAVAADVRVLLVKLADRFQDMQNLEAAAEEERRIKARETMDLYAPLAGRLGIEWLRRELENLAFQHLMPAEYAKLNAQLEGTLDERQKYVDTVLAVLTSNLREGGVEAVRVLGRPKHIYSIYKKLVAQKIPLDKVYDKVAFRIIVRTAPECFQALGIIHDKWKPVPGRFKDFISTPKANNYQSLHTTVIGPLGHFIEVQIRTEEMDRVAQEGVAAHWAYKEGQTINTSDARLVHKLKNLVKSLQDLEDPAEFMESLRGELFAPDVYVLTPTGEVRELPWGSTALDFAYAIHSAVGDTCVGARVNGHMAQLKYELKHGDMVEIITQKNQHPRRSWLQIVKTSRAKSRIRQYLRAQEKEHSLKLGKEICDRELQKYGIDFATLVKDGHLRLMFKRVQCKSLDDMLIRVGTGALTVSALVKTLFPEEFRGTEEKRRREEMLERARRAAEGKKGAASGSGAIEIDATDGMLIKASQCCRPVPGDAIIGFITTGSGLSIHRASCPNLQATDPLRWLEVHWDNNTKGNYRATLLVRAEHQKNVLADITQAISTDDATIVSLNSRVNVENTMQLDILLEVRNLKHLQVVQQRLLGLPQVSEARRQ